MAEFYLIGLTGEEVAGGALFEISRVIYSDYSKTYKAAIQSGVVNPKHLWSIIKFENPLESPDFEKKFSGYANVLYVNQTAKDILEEQGIDLRIIGEAEATPKHAGTFVSMLHYSV